MQSKSQNSQEAFLCSIERTHDKFRPKGQVCLDRYSSRSWNSLWVAGDCKQRAGGVHAGRGVFMTMSVPPGICASKENPVCQEKRPCYRSLFASPHTHRGVTSLGVDRRKREAGQTEHAILCSRLNTLFYHSAGHSNPADQIPQSPRASDGA